MTPRTYQRRIAALRQLVFDTQWVQPSYNGGHSCVGCGEMRYHGCAADCPTACVTGDYGTPEEMGCDHATQLNKPRKVRA